MMRKTLPLIEWRNDKSDLNLQKMSSSWEFLKKLSKSSEKVYAQYSFALFVDMPGVPIITVAHTNGRHFPWRWSSG
jgi:hypothetical protein